MATRDSVKERGARRAKRAAAHPLPISAHSLEAPRSNARRPSSLTSAGDSMRQQLCTWVVVVCAAAAVAEARQE